MLKLKKLRSFILIILMLISFFYVGFQIPIPEITVSPESANALTSHVMEVVKSGTTNEYSAPPTWSRVGNIIRSKDFGGDAVFFGTVKGGYCYLVQLWRNGTKRELQLFANAYDPTYGQDDSHGSPEMIFINSTHMLVVGGAHSQYTPMKWNVVDVSAWTVTTGGDFGSEELAYHTLVKLTNGSIVSFFRRGPAPSRGAYKRYDPQTNTWTDSYIFTSTTARSGIRRFGWDYDTGKRMIMGAAASDYVNFRIFLFDLENGTFLEPNGTEITLPMNLSEGIIVYKLLSAVKVNDYYYTTRVSDDDTQIIAEKRDLNFTVLYSTVILDITNFPGDFENNLDEHYFHTIVDDKLYVVGIDGSTNQTRFGRLYDSGSSLSFALIVTQTIDDIPWNCYGSDFKEPGESGNLIALLTMNNVSGAEDGPTARSMDHIAYAAFVDPVNVTASIPGTLTVGYASPEVLDVKLYNTSWYEVSSIDPYVEYWLNITIRHNNTLYALKNITIYMYASGYSWDSADDPNTHATFLWDNSTKQYSLVGPSGTTWGVNTANCRVPDQSQSTGTFTLAFNASKIALMGTWYVNVTVWGAQDLSDNLTVSFTVNFYAELNLIDSSFQFSLDVGAVNGSLVSPTDGNLNFTVICNTQYNISFYTNGNWTSDGNEIDITNTNYFIGDDDADPTDTTEGGSISEFAIHPTPYETTPYANVAVTQDDINGDAYAIYLFQTVPSGTALGTYTLILYIEVISA